MKKLLLAIAIILAISCLLVACGQVEKGEKGDKGDQGIQGIQGEQGAQGDKGDKGDKGDDGKDGKGVDRFEIINGELVIYYTDGTSQNLGKIESDEEEEAYTDGLDFYPLDDGTYAVGAGTTKRLSEVVIPSAYKGKDVTQIIRNGFENADKLKKITISNSVTTIGVGAFLKCTSLTSVVIPDSVTTIEAVAFDKCTSLTSIVIPDSVTTIEAVAFRDCTSLTIYCEATNKPAGWDSSWNYSCPVYWYSEDKPTEEGNYWHYVDGTVTVWE